MRRTALSVVALVIVGGFGTGPAVVRAQTQSPLPTWNFPGSGARAAALGGAFVGLADDGSAGFWNPSGLTQNDRVYAAMDFAYTSQRVTNLRTSALDIAFPYDNTSIANVARLSFIAFNAPVTIKGQRFYTSASWQRPADQDYDATEVVTDLDAKLPPDPTGIQDYIEAQTDAVLEGGAQVATLAAATPIKEEVLSLGFGLNIFLGDAYDSSQFRIDLDETNSFAGLTLPVRFVSNRAIRRDFQGLNFTIGALFQTEAFSVGATVKTPFTLKLLDDGRLDTVISQRTPDSVLEITRSSVLYETESTIGLPLQLAVGVTYRPQPNFILAADYEYRRFSSTRWEFQEDILDPRSEFFEVDPGYSDVHQFRLGAEYQFDVGWGVIPVRAGFRTEPQPYHDQVNVREQLYDLTGTAGRSFEGGDQVVGAVYALGAGLEWNQIRVDVTWEYTSTQRFSDGYFIDDFLRPPFIYEQTNRRHRMILGFTGYF